MSKTIIPSKELKNFKDLSENNQKNINQLGLIEFQIQKLSQEKLLISDTIIKIENNFQSEVDKLKEKYGDGNLDLSTGEFTEVKNTEETITK
jgi:hypothetical protein|tara:strand:- start:1945 stop:2220 length:276 start_codon:yes stop_codon:yes gene_type:complete